MGYGEKVDIKGLDTGTFDQSGNVWEWSDAVMTGSTRGLRGGSWNDEVPNLEASTRSSGDPAGKGNFVGFRVATVPEPSTYALLAMSAAGLGAYVLRRRCK